MTIILAILVIAAVLVLIVGAWLAVWLPQKGIWLKTFVLVAALLWMSVLAVGALPMSGEQRWIGEEVMILSFLTSIAALAASAAAVLTGLVGCFQSSRKTEPAQCEPCERTEWLVRHRGRRWSR